MWAKKCLTDNVFPREDYKELVELTVIFLSGELPSRGNNTVFHFKKPGAHHRARFMHNELYFLKIYMLSERFEMTERELDCVHRMAQYIGIGHIFYVMNNFKTKEYVYVLI